MKIIRIVSILLLIINGIYSCFGIWQLHLFFIWSEHLAYNSYLFQMVVLFAINALSSFIIAGMVLINSIKAYRYVRIQGYVLILFTLVWMVLIRNIYQIHLLYIAVAATLIILSGKILRPLSLHR